MPEIVPGQGEATSVKVYGIVDIVICLDTTGSMSGVIKSVQANIGKGLVEELDKKMTKQQGKLDWRGRVIGFGDMNCKDKMYEGTFTKDAQKLAKEIADIPRTGGGDEPESSLDALYLAAQSEWRKGPVHKVIILFTDAPPLATMHESIVGSGPRDVGRIIEELTKNRIKLFLYGQNSDSYDLLESIPKASIQTWPGSDVSSKLDKMDFAKEFEVMAATISIEALEIADKGDLPTKSL